MKKLGPGSVGNLLHPAD